MAEPEALIPEASIQVFEQDLDELLTCLTTVYHFCITQDLTKQYANLGNRVQQSPLTSHVERQRRKLKGILDDWRVDQDVSSEQPVPED